MFIGNGHKNRADIRRRSFLFLLFSFRTHCSSWRHGDGFSWNYTFFWMLLCLSPGRRTSLIHWPDIRTLLSSGETTLRHFLSDKSLSRRLEKRPNLRYRTRSLSMWKNTKCQLLFALTSLWEGNRQYFSVNILFWVLWMKCFFKIRNLW